MSHRPLRFSKISLSTAILLLPALPVASGPLAAQQAVLAVEENFRAEPNGTVLGRLQSGTRVTVVGRDGDWTRATLDGFVWTPSMQVREQDDFDLVISHTDGEAVRDEPSGRIAGRLSRGTLLEEVERTSGWIRVRRTGWIWTSALDMSDAARAGQGAGASEQPVASPPGEVSGEGPLGGRRPGEVDLRSDPDGDPVGRVLTSADVRVLAREGDWARVLVEGWVPAAAFELGADDGSGGEVLRGVSASDVAADPDRYRGRFVEMDLQFVSLEAAEEIRSDFSPGEPFLLARAVEGTRVFVYVTVPPERRGEMEALTPLERIRILGRVRSGAAEFTGSPVLELLEIQSIP